MFRNARFALFLAATIGGAAPAYAAPEHFTLDPAHTYPSFSITHLGFSVMRGEFTATSGSMVYDEQTHTGSVSARIDASSIFTGFAKRDEHLRSKAFFNVSRFPALRFQSATFHLVPGRSVPVQGKLTMLGVTRPVTLHVQPTRCGMRMDKHYVCGAIITGSIKRSDWGINAYVPFVGDEVTMHIEAEAIRQ